MRLVFVARKKQLGEVARRTLSKIKLSREILTAIDIICRALVPVSACHEPVDVWQCSNVADKLT